MEEIEAPTEHLEHEIHHQAEHSSAPWIGSIALSSALLAVLAAISALLSTQHANEGMVEEIQSSNQWSYYQAKGIKAGILSTKLEMLQALGKATNTDDKDKLAEYKKTQEEISEKAKELESSSAQHFHRHEIFARAVTMFQIAIGIAAISILTRRKKFWWIEFAFGALGIFFLVQGILIS